MATTSMPITSHIDRAYFSFWNKNDIKNISVKRITEPKSFGKAGVSHPDGLYSPTLGPSKKFDICETCGLSGFDCPGHFGHLELSVPVYHPMLIQIMFQILSKCCIQCFHFRLSQPMLDLFLAQLEALNNGFDHLIDELDEIATDLCKDNQAENDPYLQVELRKKLHAKIQDEKDKTPEFDCQKRPQQRSIVERVSKLFRSFITGKLIKPLKLCPNCQEKKTVMTLYQQSVIIMGSSGTTDSKPSKGQKKKSKSKVLIEASVQEDTDERGENFHFLKSDQKKFLTPVGARYFMRQLWKNEKKTMQRIFHFLNLTEFEPKPDPEAGKQLKAHSKFQPVDLFFIDTILVSPPKYRPPMSQRGYSFEGPRTAALARVLKQSIVVQELVDRWLKETDEIESEMLQPKIQSAWKSFQNAVNDLYDNEMDKYGKKQYPGLKQLLDKKEGLFRKNMMGKRVNFAARSVISPDPNISVDQIGVPLVFAKKLSYPEPVTPYNLQEMKQAILNGPDKYPGALSLVLDDGVVISLAKEKTRETFAARLSYIPRSNRHRTKQNTHMATIVNRHLKTGDVLLFNRQPTLHKPSIMAFRARVLPNEKGFRLHYANCKSFNADFDGDEMNAHLPQSELARSEAYNIASVNYQYLVPKDGSPLGGLIQDHVVAVCLLTERGQLLEKEHYQQLVFLALQFLGKPIRFERPAIMRPKPLWTGKQVITAIIKNCIPEGRPYPTINIKSKIGPKILNIKPEFEKLSDCNVIIRNGELLVGFMDKSNVGATQYGLVHTCYELYGGETSSNLMSAFARLSTWYLQLYEGFTLGIADILVQDDANEERQASITESLTVGPESAKEALGISDMDISDEQLEEKLRDAHSDRNPLPMKKLDAAMKTRTDKIASKIGGRCLPEGLIVKFPRNNLQMMIQSGAKGGTVNALQISCLLGQIELEGRRVPLSMSGRSLPSFKPYDTSPKAGGFVSGRFLTGIQPQEFFFHCMAGREGLIDTAVKTSRSGYLQRCLIKHLEGLTVQYDQTVRDSCGSVIQFLYGEDGLDIVKSQMLKEKAFPSLVDNHKIIAPTDDEMEKLNKSKERYEEEIIARINEIQQWIEKNGNDRTRKLRGSGFLDFLAMKLSEVKCAMDVEAGDDSKLSHDASVDGGQSNSSVKLESMETIGTGQSKTDTKSSTDDSDELIRAKMTDSQSGKLGVDAKIEKETETSMGCHQHDQVFTAWYALGYKEKRKWNKEWELCPDPLTSLFNPASHFGVVTEKLDEIIEAFVKKNPQLIADATNLLGYAGDHHTPANGLQPKQEPGVEQESMEETTATDTVDEQQQPAGNQAPNFMACDENPELSKSILTLWNQSTWGKRAASPRPKLTKHEFYDLCYNLYIKMLAHPGEAVGLLAAQSIGEPSTQMTLNTFHFAGRGEMNVTLGIPRLREILMTASAKIGTPSMDLPLLTVMRDDLGNEIIDEQAIEDQAQQVKLALNAVRLSDVLEYVDITETIVKGPSSDSTTAAVKGKGRKRPATSSQKSGKEAERSIRYDLTFAILPSKYYKHEFKASSSQVMKFIEEIFVNHLIESMLKRLKRLLNADELYDVAGKSNMRKTNKTLDQDSGAAGVDVENTEETEEQDLESFNAKAKAKEKVSKEDESSSDEDEDEEGDNTTQRLKSRRDQDQDYEEPEEDDLEVDGGDAKVAAEEEGDNEEIVEGADEDLEQQHGDGSAPSIGKLRRGQGEEVAGEKSTGVSEFEATGDNSNDAFAGVSCELAGFAGEPKSVAGGGEHVGDSEEPSRKKRKSVEGKGSKYDEATVAMRLQQVKIKPHVLDYSFDTKRERWCKLSLSLEATTTRLDMGALIEAEAKRTYVHRVGNIQRALIVKDVNAKARGARCDKMIKTEGVSLLSLVKFNHILDLNAIYTNDIHAIANTYGIEAASKAIRREMANVFAVYGIEVDPRHLSLIADYMTYNGSIRGMNRMSMEASASPFQQMSYESTIRYLKWAAILGLYDDIKSPSAALVFGRPTRGGTGLFALRAKTNQKPVAVVEQKQEQVELKQEEEKEEEVW